MTQIAFSLLIFFFLLFAPFSAFAESMTFQGGKDSSEQNFDQVEKDVLAGKAQRDANTLRPLVPLVKALENIFKENEAFYNSKAKAGTMARLLCEDNDTGLGVACSTSETNRSCLERIMALLWDMGHDSPSAACELPNPNDSWFQPDYIYRHGTVVIR
ncbi:MAG: hypothetical protein LBF22_06975 [Deltaproteobacteria bacterium]|jgi:hypothetical protein|nr:hypothetical protein [Deltaproteobacteria bacterium]